MPTVYLLHFSRPLAHARHYIGYTKDGLEERLVRHRAGHGARLVAAAIATGITVTLARAWHGAPRKWELTLKAKGGATALCPVCSPMAYKRGRLPDPEAPAPARRPEYQARVARQRAAREAQRSEGHNDTPEVF